MNPHRARQETSSEYRIESWGNGLVFEIVRAGDGATVLLQGDDALRFADELERAGTRGLEDRVAGGYFD